jgi:decaprenylphospho-beta-D-ribofuranose 2-oxidase
VTVGGAIAADVHGKNHHVDGSFASHVQSLTLLTPNGPLRCSPQENEDVFWATMGGMGLTGFVAEATIQLLPVVSDRVIVDTVRHANIDDVMADMLAHDHDYRYSVSWVDCMSKGRSMGRGIITRGDHDPSPSSVKTPPRPPRLSVPFPAPNGILNSLSIRAFNEAWFRKAPRRRTGEHQSLGTFFHPLDGVQDWNRLYGSRGFLQYQFVVPDSAGDTVRAAIELLSSSGVPSFLAVLKRFGHGNPGPLSFPIPGWTLALDLPVGPSALPHVLDQLDQLVVDAGGRIYLAKDSRLDPTLFREMYPRVDDFLAVKNRVDPHNVVVSDLSRRIGLVNK